MYGLKIFNKHIGGVREKNSPPVVNGPRLAYHQTLS